MSEERNEHLNTPLGRIETKDDAVLYLGLMKVGGGEIPVETAHAIVDFLEDDSKP